MFEHSFSVSSFLKLSFPPTEASNRTQVYQEGPGQLLSVISLELFIKSNICNFTK